MTDEQKQLFLVRTIFRIHKLTNYKEGKYFSKEKLAKDLTFALEQVAEGKGLEEAPIDGKPYARQDAGWSEVVETGTDADNGLTKTGNAIGLGGTLSGFTQIDTNSQPLFLTNVAAYSMQGVTQPEGTVSNVVTSQSWAQSGLNGGSIQLVLGELYLGHDTSVNVASGGSMNLQATGDITATEIKHGADYSATYTDRSLVDKEYVTNALAATTKFLGEYIDLASLQAAHPTADPGSYAYVDAGVGQDVETYIWDSTDVVWVKQLGESTAETPLSIKTKYESNPDTNAFTDADQTKLAAAVTGAANGLTDNAGTIELGGELIKDTEIFYNYSTFPSITGVSKIDFSFGGIRQENTDSNGEIAAFELANPTQRPLAFGYFNGSGLESVINVGSAANGGMLIKDTVGEKGFSYAGDYAVNNATNPRWLPDKEYIDNLVASGSTTAINGLTKTGNDIKLGGVLTEDTEILGDGARSLSLGTDASKLDTLNVDTVQSTTTHTNGTDFDTTEVVLGEIGTKTLTDNVNNYVVQEVTRVSPLPSIVKTITTPTTSSTFRHDPQGFDFLTQPFVGQSTKQLRFYTENSFITQSVTRTFDVEDGSILRLGEGFIALSVGSVRGTGGTNISMVGDAGQDSLSLAGPDSTILIEENSSEWGGGSLALVFESIAIDTIDIEGAKYVNPLLTANLVAESIPSWANVEEVVSGATLTDAEIKTKYENNADTNAFTDADETKLDASVTDGINGLTKVADDIKLGGTLTEATTIGGAQPLSLGGPGSELNNFDVRVNGQQGSLSFFVVDGPLGAPKSAIQLDLSNASMFADIIGGGTAGVYGYNTDINADVIAGTLSLRGKTLNIGTATSDINITDAANPANSLTAFVDNVGGVNLYSVSGGFPKGSLRLLGDNATLFADIFTGIATVGGKNVTLQADPISGTLALIGQNIDLNTPNVEGAKYVTIPSVLEDESIPAWKNVEDGIANTNYAISSSLMSAASVAILDPTTLQITGIDAIFYDTYANPRNVTKIEQVIPSIDVPIGAQTDGLKALYLDSTGAVLIIDGFLEPEDPRDLLLLGGVIISGAVAVDVRDLPEFNLSLGNQVWTLMRSLGTFSVSGNVVTPNANLTLSRSGGIIFGAYTSTNPKNPHRTTVTGASPMVFEYVTEQGQTLASAQTNVDPNQYWDGAALQPVATGDWSIQRVYLAADGSVTFIVYGNRDFNNANQAIQAVGDPSNNVLPDALSGSILLGYVVTETGATDLTIQGEARILTASTIGSNVSAGNAVRSTTIATTATLTVDVSITDQASITAQAGPLTIANPIGSPEEGHKVVIRVKDDGTARALTFGAEFRVMGTPLPTTTVAGKLLYIGAIYNATDASWDVVAVNQEA